RGEPARLRAPPRPRGPASARERELGSVMATRASTGKMAGRAYLNIAGSQYANTDLAGVVAALEALDLEDAPLGALVPLLAACAATEARIAVRLATAVAESPAPPPAAPETFMSVKAAAARLGVEPKWL